MDAPIRKELFVMAEKRMFTKKVTDDDNFINLSSSAQALYLHLSMSADDDGFSNQVTISMFKAHASVQDLQALLELRYIYQFDNGVIVIKHWRMANALRKDRYTPTAFQEELSKLDIKENGSYTWLPDGCQVVAERLPQNIEDKDSLDKNSLLVSDDTNCHTGIQLVIDEWNSLGLAPVKYLSASAKRTIMLKARIKEYGVDGVLEAINNIRNSNFLNGQNKNGWVITFDWFVKPGNFIKVFEHNYDNREIVHKPVGFMDA